jgi:putative tricarboxylic transport membrane protein
MPRRIRASMIGALLAFATAAVAQPFDQLKILVPANPGGGWDQTGRNLAQAMSAAGVVKRVTIDNKGGAGGTIGIAQFVNSAKGDPAAMMIGGMVMAGAIIQNKSPVNLSMVTPLARLTGEYEVVVVPASSPIKDAKDLLAKFKANPGSVSWGGGSAGGTDHILAALLAKSVGGDARQVNYIAAAGGGEASAAILGGHVTASISGYGEYAQLITSGRLRALGISSAKRVPGIDVPTFKEQGIDVELMNWRGVFGPPGINAQQKAALEKAIADTVRSKAWQDILKKMDWIDLYSAGDEFKAYIEKENAVITQLMNELGLVKK